MKRLPAPLAVRVQALQQLWHWQDLNFVSDHTLEHLSTSILLTAMYTLSMSRVCLRPASSEIGGAVASSQHAADLSTAAAAAFERAQLDGGAAGNRQPAAAVVCGDAAGASGIEAAQKRRQMQGGLSLVSHRVLSAQAAQSA